MKIFFSILAVIAATIIFVSGLQIGILHGRTLERKEANLELEQLEARFKGLKEDYKSMQAVVECESNGRHYGVWGDGGTSYGIAQFQHRTFRYLAKLANRDDLRWEKKDDQLTLLWWAIQNEQGNNWTCYKKYNKGGGLIWQAL